MLNVHAFMSSNPHTVEPQTTLRELLALMNTHGWRQVPVARDGLLQGIVTDRDLRLAINSPVVVEETHLDRAELLEDLTVESCMTRDPLTVSPDQPAHEAADLMSVHKFGALPVVEDGRLVGIITSDDFLRYFVRHPPEQE